MTIKSYKPLFSSARQHWSTPKDLYESLNKEFDFNDDPCPLSDNGIGGLLRSWGSSTFLNPPYGNDIGKWLSKAQLEASLGKIVVCLIPSRTDTKWWHEYVMKATEVRYLRGRLKFGDSKNSAPFPSCIVIFFKGN
jgi:site-specific DNA-methyltransferase (adenine-specific)